MPEDEMLEIIAPQARRRLSENGLVITSAEMITDKELALKTATLRMFNIGAAVNTMEVEIEKADDLPVS